MSLSGSKNLALKYEYFAPVFKAQIDCLQFWGWINVVTSPATLVRDLSLHFDASRHADARYAV